MRHVLGGALLGVSFGLGVAYITQALHAAYRARHPKPWPHRLAHFHALIRPDRCSCGEPWPCLDTTPGDRERTGKPS